MTRGRGAGLLILLDCALLFPWRCCWALVSTIKDGNKVSIPLKLAMEKQLWQRNEPPISTLTWFEGEYVQATRFFRERAVEIQTQNTWLGGRVVSNGGHGSLEYDESIDCRSSANSAVHVVDKLISPVSTFTPVQDLYKATSSLTLTTREDSLWKITLCPCQRDPDRHFCLVFSLSHLVGDIAVFYKLLHMLCDGQKVEALQLDEPNMSDKLAMKALGRDAFAFQNSPAMMVKGAIGLVQAKIFTIPIIGNKKRSQEFWFRVKKDAMQAEKRAAQTKVSTNDVLTSWFFRQCGCSIGLMCVNYRNKLEHHVANLGRNYWGTIAYQPEDFQSPSLIRQSLSTWKRTRSGSLPTALDFIREGSIAIATSWTGWSSSNNVPNCKEVFHCPLFDFASYCPSSFAVLRVFNASPGEIGVYVAGDGGMVDGLAKGAPFLKPLVAEDWIRRSR